MKLLILNGSADLRGRDDAFFDVGDPRVFFANGDINTGDVLVYDAILKQIDFDDLFNIQFANIGDAELPADFVPDLCVIRGSNYLNKTLDLGAAVPLIERLACPVVAIGIGAQSGKDQSIRLPEGSVKFWKAVSERSVSIGIRGEFSKAILANHGIHNVRLIGCPSFYRGLKPELLISRPEYSQDLRIGATLNSFLRDDYASDHIKTLRMQRALLVAVAAHGKGYVYSQGEREESLAVYGSPDQKDLAVRKILEKFQTEPLTSVEHLLRNRLIALFDVREWTRDAKSRVDFMIGFRLHGNVIALHQEIPSIFFTYDQRLRELVDLFCAPFVEVDNFLPLDLRALVTAADFTPFERAYRRNYAEYHMFLTENGVRHRLPKPVVDFSTPRESTRCDLSHAATGDVARLIKWFGSEYADLSRRMIELEWRAWDIEKWAFDMKRELAERQVNDSV